MVKLKNKENIIFNVNLDLFSKEIDDALNNKSSKGNINLGKNTNSEVVMMIKNQTGIDIKNRNHILSKDYIRHLYKHSKEKSFNQIPITKNDIKKIPDIIFFPDIVVKGSNTLDSSRKVYIPSIRYVKEYDDGKLYVIESIPIKGNLQIKTMWKESTKLIHGNFFHHTS